MVWRLPGLTFDVDSTDANGHLFAVIGQPTNFNFGADCFPGCGVEGLKDCVCVRLDGDSCWHGVSVTANVNPAQLYIVIVRVQQMFPC